MGTASLGFARQVGLHREVGGTKIQGGVGLRQLLNGLRFTIAKWAAGECQADDKFILPVPKEFRTRVLDAIRSAGVDRTNVLAVGMGYSPFVHAKRWALSVYANEECSASKRHIRSFHPGFDLFLTKHVSIRPMGLFRGPSGERLAKVVRPGCCISHQSLHSPGTLGCILRGSDRKDRYILSAGHVLSDSGFTVMNGDVVYQPPNGQRKRVVSSNIQLCRSHRTSDRNRLQILDAGVAKLSPEITYDPRIPGVGLIATLAAPSASLPVQKYGAQSGHKVSRILHESFTFIHQKAGNVDFFSDDLFTVHNDCSITRSSLSRRNSKRVKPWAKAGDCGSIVLDLAGRPLGLIVAVATPDQSAPSRSARANEPEFVFVQRLQPVLDHFGLRVHHKPGKNP
ncbi:MAG: hypothetical protein RBS39_08940 [Phycisphaerales bacterium]|jgi:hypothetical protein|nr:hypothetical protein [Phycisphaerales bacterium]